jgi:SAM-dependent methyltransferase
MYLAAGMAPTAEAARPYERQRHDAVRAAFETPWFDRTVARLVRSAGGGEVLDLGCGDGAAARAAGSRLTRYLGVDLAPRAMAGGRLGFLRHDLREGLGDVGARPFDLYLGTFGVASHLAPRELRRLLREIARHARPGALVALEALGLYSLEWPHLWDRPAGAGRTMPYPLPGEVAVHPWAAGELHALFDQAGVEPLFTRDRTLQAGPKTGARWPGIPPLRRALNGLLTGSSGERCEAVLASPLPPLPAGRAALVHHTLAGRRRALVVAGHAGASEVWRLEPHTAGGYGHGLLVAGRVRA